MNSITYWNRLEPRPRSETDILPSLAAKVRDPLWFLTRQWQMSEFHGEDAGSPAWMRASYRTSEFTGWRVEGEAVQPLTGSDPLEDLAETEAFGADYATRVELGQRFETMLRDAGLTARISEVRQAYPLVEDPEIDLASDREAARFFAVVAGRASDGGMLFQESAASAPSLPAALLAEIPGSAQAAVLPVLAAYLAEVREVYGEVGVSDGAAWKPERLEYGVEAMANTPDGQSVTFRCDPDRDGGFEWYALDVKETVPVDAGPLAPEPATKSLLPVHVRFRGMPNQRWWDFEEGQTDFGAIQPDKRDLARLVVMDFMLVHGNDWYLIPLRQPVGTLMEVEWVIVHDVFGDVTHVPRADAAAVPADQRWTMFTLTAPGLPNGITPYLVQPPTAGGAVIEGPVLEEVRFLRDEMANMVWGIEETLEGGIGQPLPGLERYQATRPPQPAPPGPEPTGPHPPLTYRIQTEVPENWIPFLPALLNEATGDIALQIASMLRILPGGAPVPITPLGRILKPASVAAGEYRIREEEVTRAGTRVNRTVRRSRWTDGSTHIWVSRRRTVGAGEGSSGLKYDIARPNRSEP